MRRFPFIRFVLFAFASFSILAFDIKARGQALADPAPVAEKDDVSRKDIPCVDQSTPVGEYTVGVEDILEISILKPEALTNIVSVSPDGSITFPYVGNIVVKGKTIAQVQEEFQTRLADGYMKYPVVSVSLKESRSRKFFVYGEVLKPGSYPIEESTSVLKAISMAGGFTRFGSSSRVKVLRPRKNGSGYNPIKVNITAVMDGDCNQDILLRQGDIVIISEGVF